MTKKKAVTKVVDVEKKPPADHSAGVIPLLQHDPRNHKILETRRRIREIKRGLDITPPDLEAVMFQMGRLIKSSAEAQRALQPFTAKMLKARKHQDALYDALEKLQNNDRVKMKKNLREFNAQAFKKPKGKLQHHAG